MESQPVQVEITVNHNTKQDPQALVEWTEQDLNAALMLFAWLPLVSAALLW